MNINYIVKYLFFIFLLFLILGADFIMPYRYDTILSDTSFHPPQLLYDYTVKNKGLKQYEINKESSINWQWLVRGEPYSFLCFKCSLHLFGRKQKKPLYLLGGDALGRDLFSRLIWASRLSLSLAFLGVASTFFLGLFLGSLGAYSGALVDRLLIRIGELLMCFPFFFLMLALRGIFPSSLNSWQTYACIVCLMGCLSWPSLARVIRGMVLSLKEKESVLAMKCAGASNGCIIFRYILPHTYSYAVVAAILNIPSYILAEAGLSLLGFGIQEPYASWGNMLKESMSIHVIHSYPWMLLPALFLGLTVMAFFIVFKKDI